MLYCQIDENENILAGPVALPKHGVRLTDGARCGDLDRLPVGELCRFGWLPAIVDRPQLLDYQEEVLESRVLNETDGTVLCTYVAVDNPVAVSVEGLRAQQSIRCTQTIEDTADAVDQRNMLARWSDIQDIATTRELTAQEQDERAYMRAVWDWVKDVRTIYAVWKAEALACATVEELRAVALPVYPAFVPPGIGA